jgi:SMC interacting uncharacterized protein involved in chromosome segregation
MKSQSPYVVREGDETRVSKRAAVKWNGKGKKKVSSGEEDLDKQGGTATGGEVGAGPSGSLKGKGSLVLAKRGGDVGAAEGSQGRGKGAVVGSEGAGPLTVRIPAPSQGSSLSKADPIIRALQAKVHRLEYDLGKELDKAEDLLRLSNEVQRLEAALRTEEERTEGLVESKEKYKGMVRGLQATARDRIRVLEAAVENGEADRRELQRRLEAAQAGVSTELEELRQAAEEYVREKDDFEEWKTTGTRRMVLAQELGRAEDDRTRLRARVLALEREAKEHVKWRKEQEVNLEDLEEELKAVVEKGEAAQACTSELVQSSAGEYFF